MNYSKYTRSFIILDDKKSDFRNTKENIKGHVKIELRNNQGTLKCNVQNLKYYEDARYLYKLYFFGKKADNTIFTNAGTLYIDKQGRGEHFIKFNPLDLDGDGNELYDFSILAVIAQPNKDIVEDDIIFPVLSGYLSKESRSVSHSDDNLISLKSKEKEKVLQESLSNTETEESSEHTVNTAYTEQNIEENTASEESVIDVSSPETDSKVSSEDVSSTEPKSEKLAPDVSSLPETDSKVSSEDASSTEPKSEKITTEGSEVHKPEEEQKEKEVPLKTAAETSEPLNESVKENTLNNSRITTSSKPLSKKVFDTSSYFSNYVRAVSTNLEKVLSFYNRTEPFEQDRIGCKWWKIINLMSIPFANTSYLQGYSEHMRPYNMSCFNPREFCPSCHDLIYKYQHYIFGINREEKSSVKYYYYGIPGRYMKEEQPDNGKSGFQYWQPLQGTDKKIGDYGYWIIGINSQTGQFEIPVEE